MKTIDVIIPTYKPTGKLVRIIEMLEKQTYSVNKIIIINTEKEYFDDFFKDKDILDSYDNILVKHIKR
jgi:rhamnosyltransferase